MSSKKRVSPIQKLKNEIAYLTRELENKNLLLLEQNKRLAILDRIANSPPTVMIACERLVEAAAHQVSDMLQFVKETRHAQR